jgi:putative serine protease PepD
MKIATRPMTIAAVALAVGAGGGVGAAAIAARDPAATTTTTVTAPAATLSPAAQTTTTRTLEQLYSALRPGVVDIKVVTGDGQAEGSGFVLDTDGHILTNDHVVDGAKKITVTFSDKSTTSAQLVGADASSDLAVIKVDPSAAKLTPLTFADSSDAQVGDAVLAIGSPFGLQGTLTTGIVSALDRPIQAPDNFTIPGAIQTDAPINSGNSGGPLINADGKVIGVNSQIESQSGSNAGIGFAIASNTASTVAQQLVAGTKVQHAFLGASIGDGETTGATIGRVTAGSPAAKAGLKADDLVTAVDGQTIDGADDLAAAVASHKPGDSVTFHVRRDGATQDVQVQLGTH